MHRHAFVALIAAAALAVPAASTLASSPPRNGAIAYAWIRVEPQGEELTRHSAGISLIDPDGTRARDVAACEDIVPADVYPPPTTCTMASFGSPAFSLDGTQLAFDGGTAIAIAPADGSGVTRRLPSHGEDDGDPAFSPTGRRLAFSTGTNVSAGSRIRRSLWVMDADGANARQISPRGSSPAWSRRNVIAFVRSGEIWVVRPDGSGLRQVTGGGGYAPAWSPDGRRIAFSRHGSIFVVDPSARRLRRVARGHNAVGLAWSPDGRRLAIRSFRRGLRTIALDGTGLRSLVAEDLGDLHSYGHRGIAWQPLH